MPWVKETVESVLSQGCTDLDYIVIDGASTDGTREYLESMSPRFSNFISEPDGGQYAAIAKGMALAKGDILGWINGDDLLMPWSLKLVTRIFRKFPSVDWITGIPAYLNANSECTMVSSTAASYPRQFLKNGWFREGALGYLMQESTFWRRSLWERAGGLDLKWKLAADFDLWTRFAEHAELTTVAAPLAGFRILGQHNRSRQGTAYRDEVYLCCNNRPSLPLHWRPLLAFGKSGEMLLRTILWAKTPVIAHSRSGQEWILTRCFRPIARDDIPRLILERNVLRLESN